ncbi:MAG: HesA/MoeB/ThiF family protein [Firmicutes bacterium]|nr:HesA/MoeB/ThiF family protein [Bacillota bacterium]
MSMALNELSREIYQRQILLPELGEDGQEKLAASSVLVCGCGGLGSPALLYLAAMGIGRLGLLDGDVVSYSNLNRQVLYGRSDVGRRKAEAAAERIRFLNPDIKLDVHGEYLTEDNASSLLFGYDLALDCLDNFPARFILNDACLSLDIPFIHGGVNRLRGQTMTVIPGRTACLRCLFPGGIEDAPDTDDKAIIGATAGVIASLQVTEAFKYLTGQPVNRGLLMYDGKEPGARLLGLEPDPNCICQTKSR